MARENINRMIHKADNWPLKERLRYLQACYAIEKGAHRRRMIHLAMVPLTTKVLKQELRGAK